jgi:hypothetical protein
MDPPYFAEIHEIVNVKPDDINFSLCAACGSPHHLQLCGRCKATRYCSRTCQREDWKLHKKTCKEDGAFYDAYLQEKEGTKDVPRKPLDGGRECLRKFDPANKCFETGDAVECLVGPDVYGTGHILKVLHCYDGQDTCLPSSVGWTVGCQVWLPSSSGSHLGRFGL